MIFSKDKNQKKELQKKIDLADSYLNSPHHSAGIKATLFEEAKRPFRTDIINFTIQSLNRETTYLEIGVREPDDNFNKISSEKKYSVDPGYENAENNVDFKMTSDAFFNNLRKGNVLESSIKFDVIFIDGLHLADQVERDINNALEFLEEDGYIIMHDCNPPTEYHASEDFSYKLSPAGYTWNGTTWKAFFKARKREDLYSCCVDTDWGVGVLSKSKSIGTPSKVSNEFYEYKVLEAKREESLNLVSFEQFQKLVTV